MPIVAERKFRISVAHGKMEYLTGHTYLDLEGARTAAKNTQEAKMTAYHAGQGRKGHPPTVRLLEVVEEF